MSSKKDFSLDMENSISSVASSYFSSGNEQTSTLSKNMSEVDSFTDTSDVSSADVSSSGNKEQVFYTAKEACEKLQITIRTLYKYINNETIRAEKVGPPASAKWSIAESEIEKLHQLFTNRKRAKGQGQS